LADIITTIDCLGDGWSRAESDRIAIYGARVSTGLILSKVIMLATAAVAIRYRKFRAIRCANLIFGAIVLWNITVIIRMVMAFAHG
jgi:hypothetical protein